MPGEVLLNTFSPPQRGLGAGGGGGRGDRELITSSGMGRWHGAIGRAGGTVRGQAPRCGGVGQPPQLGLRKQQIGLNPRGALIRIGNLTARKPDLLTKD